MIKNVFMFILSTILFFYNYPIFAGSGTVDICPRGNQTLNITKSGSYVLVKSVTMTTPNINCINITASNVSLDLNGNAIIGTGSTSNDGSAIITDQTISNVRIFNGTISDFGGAGITAICKNVQISDITVSKCAHGVYIGDNSLVKNVTATDNKIYGIKVGYDCLVEKCVAKDNGCAGIFGEKNNVIRGCVANSNGDGSTLGIVYGIASGSSVIENNVCNQNEPSTTGWVYGIAALDSTISGNTCNDNHAKGVEAACAGINGTGIIINNTCVGNISELRTSGIQLPSSAFNESIVNGNICTFNSGSGAYGIYAMSKATILNNVCSNNKGDQGSYGIYAGIANSKIENNTCTQNTPYLSGLGYGINITGSGNSILSNKTYDNTTKGIYISGNNNYYANNMYGTVESIEVTGSGNIAGTGDNANISH